jgi:hypothetical protein
MGDIIESLQRGVHWLIVDLKDFAYAAADRNTPALPGRRAPIGGDDRRAYGIPALWHVVIDKGLDQGLIDILVGAGNSPKLACQSANHPRLGHHQPDGAKTHAERTRSEHSLDPKG